MDNPVGIINQYICGDHQNVLPFGRICPKIGRVGDWADPIDDVVHEQLPGMLPKPEDFRVVVELSFGLRLRNLTSLKRAQNQN